MVMQEFTKYTITASNSGGSLSTDILIEIIDIPVENIQYPNYYFNLTKNKAIDTNPNLNGKVESLYLGKFTLYFLMVYF